MSDPATIRTSPHTPHELRQVLQRLASLLHVHEDTKSNPHSVTIDQAITSGVGEGGAAGSAKGDMLARDGSNEWDNLIVGSDDEVLIADAAETLGVKWGTVPSHAHAGGDITSGSVANARLDSDLQAIGDLATTEGFYRKTGSGTVTVHKSNLAAASAPTVNDDSSAGYSVGSRWIDTTADKEYVCLDVSVGAAVWTETTGGTHTLLNGSTHSDTASGSVARGDVIVGNSTPKWSRLAKGTTGQILVSDGTDVAWANSGPYLGPLTLIGVAIESSTLVDVATYVGDGANSKYEPGLRIKASLAATAYVHFRYWIPHAIPSGTFKGEVWTISKATNNGALRFTLKAGIAGSGDVPSSASLTTLGSGTLTYTASTDDEYLIVTVTPGSGDPGSSDVGKVYVVQMEIVNSGTAPDDNVWVFPPRFEWQ